MMPPPDNKPYIRHTQTWLSSVIIAHTFCPFAKREFDNDHIHYAVIETTDVRNILDEVMAQCAALDKHDAPETSLLIIASGLSDFEDYLDVLHLANETLVAQGYEGTYQLASFHPNYRFEDAEPEDPANFTNRSPYPMIHILREASIEATLKTYPNPENIPARNIERAQKLGLQAMKDLLAQCYED